jgi:hypothetical protein
MMARMASSVISQAPALSRGRELALEQIALGDLDFLLLGVAGSSMISMRSRSGPGMVSITLAVPMNITRKGSNGTAR